MLVSVLLGSGLALSKEELLDDLCCQATTPPNGEEAATANPGQGLELPPNMEILGSEMLRTSRFSDDPVTAEPEFR